MASDVLDIRLDVVEPRVSRDRLVVLNDGKSWDLFHSGTVGLDHVTYSTMLLPVPYYDAWQTTTTGVYKRFVKADYNLTTPNSWTAFDRNGLSGNTYLHSKNINEKVYTGASLLKNQGVYLSWFAYNGGNSRFVQMECGWGEGALDGDVRLRFWSDNSVEVYRNGFYVGNGNLDDNSYYPSDFGPQKGASGGKAQQNAQQTVDVLLIPCRFRELLILSPTQGGGFNQLFEDIDTGETLPTITGTGPFWWYVPEGQATVQLHAPLQCGADGFVLGPATKLRYAPPAGAVFDVSVSYDAPGFGTVTVGGTVMDLNGAAAFVPDGSLDTVRIKVAMTGDGTATPFVYNALASYSGAVANTAGGSVSIMPYVLHEPSPHLDVSEEASNVKFVFSVFSPDAAEAGGVALLRTLGNRAFDVRMGTSYILKGRTEAPVYEFGISDEVSRLTIEGRDRWKAFEKFLIADPEPLDQSNLSLAFAYFAKLPGYSDSDLDIEAIDFELPGVPTCSQGEYALIPEVGESAGEWLERLHEDYAKNYWIGWRPVVGGTKFCVWGTTTLGTAPVKTLFDTVDGAGGTVGNVFRSYKETVLEPEANDIYAVGLDPRSGVPIIAHVYDPDSQEPTTAVASRPLNWLGEKRKYSLIDPAITTQSVANWAAATLFIRLAIARFLVEWKCDFLRKSDGVPVWKGDPVRLTNQGVFRVVTISAPFPNEWDTVGTANVRDCVYTGEFLSL